MTRLIDLASVCKSKNAGPFDLTIDVIFSSRALFDRVAATGILNAALFATLYKVKESDVLLRPIRQPMPLKRRCLDFTQPAPSMIAMCMALSSMPQYFMLIFLTKAKWLRANYLFLRI